MNVSSSLTARLDLCLGRMSIHLPFVAAIAMSMRVKIEKCGTACTNGTYIKFDPDFCAAQSDHELLYLYAHETWHKALMHVWRRGTRDPVRWNWACDHVINLALTDMRNPMLRMPKGGLADPRYRGMSEEEVYESSIKDGIKMPRGFAIDIIEKDARSQADAEIEIINIAKACKMAGISAGLLDIILANAGKPSVDWRDVLRSFVSANVRSGQTWRRRSRRSHEVYLPALRSKVLGSIVIFGDFSDSMMDEVKVIIAEMQGIIDDVSPEFTHVICGDTRVTFSHTFERGSRIELKMRGGGGTDFRPLFAEVEKQTLEPDCGVFLTDTFGSFPDVPPNYPVIWGVIGKGGSVPWGETVNIKT